MVKAHSTTSATAEAVRLVRSVNKEQVEIQMYLSKLKELVPHMPRHRKVSKLEVIQHVIDYICDLQTALEQNNRRPRRPSSCLESTPQAAALSTSVLASSRQPLGLLSSIPNTSEVRERISFENLRFGLVV